MTYKKAEPQFPYTAMLGLDSLVTQNRKEKLRLAVFRIKVRIHTKRASSTFSDVTI